MSKESYARGFCKAAEAAGVDPVALAKYAQQYKTDGYAPNDSKSNPPEKGQIPLYRTPFRRGSELMQWDHIYDMDKGNPMPFLINESTKGFRLPVEEKLRQEVMPEHKAWFDAHTNAASKALAPLEKVDYPLRDYIAPDVKDRIYKIYHDEMKRTTSAPPVQVSAPNTGAAVLSPAMRNSILKLTKQQPRSITRK